MNPLARAIMAQAGARDPLALTGTPVVLVLGQSNAVGDAAEGTYSPRAGVDYTAAVPAVRYWLAKSDADSGAVAWGDLEPGPATIGPEMQVGRDLYAEHGIADLHVFKHAVSGSRLAGTIGSNTWDPSTDSYLWGTVKTQVAAALALAPGDAAVHHVVWIQGEADCNVTDSPNYATNLAALIAASRAEWGPQVRWHVVKLHGRSGLSTPSMSMAVYRAVRAAQASVCAADSLAYIVDIEHAPLLASDDLHYPASGYIDIGQACAESVATARGLIAAQGDAGATPLLDWDTGTFARASAKTFWDEATLTRYASGAIVKDASGYVDIEGARTNLIQRSDDLSTWWSAGTATRSTVTATRLDGTSGNVSQVAAGNAQYGPFNSSISVGAGAVAASLFLADPGSFFDYQVRMRTRVDPSTLSLYSELPSAWGRRELIGYPAGSQTVSCMLPEQINSNPTATDPALAAVTMLIGGVQVEVGDSASSLIETAGATATRLADNLSYASGDVPTTMRTGAWSFGLTVPWAWDQLIYDRTLFAWGTGATDRIWYDASTHRITVTVGGVDVATSLELVFLPGAQLTVSVDAAAGTVSVRGAQTGNGVGPTGTAWTMPSADLQIGARSDLTEAAFARLGEPY